MYHKRGHKENSCRPTNVKSPDHQTPSKSAHQTHKKMNQRRKSHSVSTTFKVDFKSRRRYISVGLNEIPVRFQFDTTSDITFISRNTWTKIGKPDVLKTRHVAQSTSGNDIRLTGELNCSVSFQDKQFTGTCCDRCRSKSKNLIFLPSHWNLFSIHFPSSQVRRLKDILLRRLSRSLVMFFERIWDVARRSKQLSSWKQIVSQYLDLNALCLKQLST